MSSNIKNGPIAEPSSLITNNNYNGSDLRPLPAKEWLNLKRPQPEQLVEDMLLQGELVLLSGLPKTGKSTFLRHLAVSVAKGTPVLGKYKVKQCPVWYLALEEHPSMVIEAFKNLGVTESDPLSTWFDPPGPFKTAVQKLEQGIEQEHFGLVIVDTAWKLSDSDFDTNNYSDMVQWATPFLDITHKQRDVNICLVMAHHDNKGHSKSKGPDALKKVSGSTALTGQMDSIFRIDITGEKRELSNTGRYGNFGPVVMNMNPATGDLTHGGSPEEFRVLSKKNPVLEALKAHGEPVPSKDLLQVLRANGAKGKSDTLKATVSELVAEESIEINAGGAYLARI